MRLPSVCHETVDQILISGEYGRILIRSTLVCGEWLWKALWKSVNNLGVIR